MSTWQQDVTCPRCGDELALVNHTTNGTLAVSITECLSCNWSFEISTRLRPFTRPESIRRARYRSVA